MEDQEARSGSNWDTLPRYKTIYDILKKHNGKIGLGIGQRILSNHSGYVCSHQRRIKLGTIWSIIATLKGPELFRAEGHPCQAKYRQDLRLSKAVQGR